MKWITIIACVAALGGCVTPGDLARINDQMAVGLANVQATIDDPAATPDDVAEQIEVATSDLAAEIDDVAAIVAERTEGWLHDIGGAGGPIGIAAMLGLNFWRNQNRRKRGEPVTIRMPAKPKE